MKNLSIWQRLNLAVGLMILLLLIGGALAIWMERANAQAQLQGKILEQAQERIAMDLNSLTEVSHSALLGQLEPKGERLQQAENRLRDSLGFIRKEWGRHREMVSALDRVEDLAKRSISPFNETVVTLAKTNQAAALAYYAGNYPGIRDLQDQRLQDVGTQIQAIVKNISESATTVSMISLGGIVLVLGAALIVCRIQSRSVTAPMQTIVSALERMQQGDFTARVQMDRGDEFGAVGNSLNKLADELSVLVGQVQRSGIQVNSTTTEIAATAREQQSTANEIAATTAEIGATSREISATSKELVKTMNEVSHVAEETTDLAGSGQNSIAKMEDTIRQIMDASGSITSKLAVLNDKTSNINTVVTTITKVADQTNLLSLNAAIEAEKAGEYGLGFAVVAMEIRRLADQTAVATYDIEKMVREMQSAVSAGVMGMDKFSEEVRRGVEEVRQVGGQLAQIIHQVQTLTPRFQTVNEGMHAQATGAQQISETLTQLNEATQLTAESLRQSNAAIEQLNEAARGLQAGVARFKLKTG